MMNSLMIRLMTPLIASILEISIARQNITGAGSWVPCLLLLSVIDVSKADAEIRFAMELAPLF